ncbi:hypothetical protein [Olleya sp. R77988]|uniref:hypothetical protein n=1 Tax=Olleya sp. R77988 TaxID=3093875 RepID=UPI0037C88D8D
MSSYLLIFNNLNKNNMYTKEEAQVKMQKYVGYKNRSIELNHGYFPGVIIYEHLTEDYGFGWVFYWQVNDEDAKDPRKIIIGNGPMLIEKETLNMYMLGTGQEIAEQIEEFKEDKDSFLQIEEDEWGNFDAINR